MRTKSALLCMVSLLLLAGLKAPANGQSPHLAGNLGDDTVDIAVEYHSVYPGWYKWIVVSMRNSVPVAGYSLFFQLSSTKARFSCDTSGQCFMDTTGCSANAFSYASCLCQGNGGGVHAAGIGEPGEFIPPSPGYDCLFRIRMDACCIPDADTLRSAFILLAPATSSVSDTLGNMIPWRYSMGELFVFWSVPGDANSDSMVDVADLVFLIGYVLRQAQEPCVCEAADCDSNGTVDIGDIIYLVNYLFLGGSAPLEGGASCWHEECWPWEN
jgi:hypothetical protein